MVQYRNAQDEDRARARSGEVTTAWQRRLAFRSAADTPSAYTPRCATCAACMLALPSPNTFARKPRTCIEHACVSFRAPCASSPCSCTDRSNALSVARPDRALRQGTACRTLDTYAQHSGCVGSVEAAGGPAGARCPAPYAMPPMLQVHPVAGPRQ